MKLARKLDKGQLIAEQKMVMNHEGRFQTCYAPTPSSPPPPLPYPTKKKTIISAFLSTSLENFMVSDMEKVSGKETKRIGWNWSQIQRWE